MSDDEQRAIVSPGQAPDVARRFLGDEMAEAIDQPGPYELPSDVDPEVLGQMLKAAMGTPDVSDEFPHTFVYEPREYMRAGEIAAEISGDKDVHVDCVLAVLDWLAAKWEVDTDELVRFDVRSPYTITEITDDPA